MYFQNLIPRFFCSSHHSPNVPYWYYVNVHKFLYLLFHILHQPHQLSRGTRVYYGKNVPLFQRNGYRKSGAMIP